MNYFNQAPFTRLLLPFAIGILTGMYNNKPFWLDVAIGLCFVPIVFMAFSSRRHGYFYSRFFGVLIFALLFLTGFRIILWHTEINNPHHFSHGIKKQVFLYAMATEPFLEKERSIKLSMRVLAVKGTHEWIGTSGKVMVYFQKDSNARQIKYGDCVVMDASVRDVLPPQNPYEMDYRSYLAHHGIYQQAFVKSNDWSFTGSNEGKLLFRLSHALRARMLDIFSEHGLEGDNFAVISALLLGYSAKLDADLLGAYARTGTLHVLSVSGLHVGIIYFVFNLMFLFLEKFKHGKTIKALILLLLLWFYAVLTGLSPSVLRATTMFSFIVVGSSFNRFTNIYNTLAVSAFFLLLLDPWLLVDVGFQLSYIAVLGIVYLQPRIYGSWQPDNFILDKAWVLTSVSIAAQVATFPVSLYYFHQFPNYFLVANLLVIPLSTLVMYAGMLVLALGWIPGVSMVLSKCLQWSTMALNSTVRLFEGLPYSVIQGIYLSVWEMCFLYVLLFFMLGWIVLKGINMLLISMALAIGFLSLQVFKIEAEHVQKKMIVFNIQKTSACELISGRNALLLADSMLLANESKMLFHVRPSLWEAGVKNEKVESLGSKQKAECKFLVRMGDFIWFGNKRILYAHSGVPAGKSNLKIDYLILTGNSNMSLKSLLHHYYVELVIIDSSCPGYKVKKWKAQCDQAGVDFYSVIDSGAFVATFYSPRP